MFVATVHTRHLTGCQHEKDVMGTLYYGAHATPVRFDDRLLAHLRAAIIAKLRRDEKFVLSWQSEDEPARQYSIWVHPAIELRFEFDGPSLPLLNRAWVERLVGSANTAEGMRAVPEPDPTPRPSRA
jgi:hypothetical protein